MKTKTHLQPNDFFFHGCSGLVVGISNCLVGNETPKPEVPNASQHLHNVRSFQTFVIVKFGTSIDQNTDVVMLQWVKFQEGAIMHSQLAENGL